MTPDAEMVAAIEIVVASQFPQAVPLIHQAAITHELLCNAGHEATYDIRLGIIRTLTHLSQFSGMTLTQVAFAWLSHPNGIEGFMDDRNMSQETLIAFDQKLAATLHILQESINAINDEAMALQEIIADIYKASD